MLRGDDGSVGEPGYVLERDGNMLCMGEDVV